jgi:hypothetical protein
VCNINATLAANQFEIELPQKPVLFETCEESAVQKFKSFSNAGGPPLGGRSRAAVVIQPFEISFRTAHGVDHSVGKHGEEFVCERGLVVHEPVACIVLHFQKQRVLLDCAGAIAPRAVNQRDLAEDVGWA